jgi:hypothetical protein
VWLFLNRKERKVREGLERFFLACFAVNSVCNSSNHTIKGDYLEEENQELKGDSHLCAALPKRHGGSKMTVTCCWVYAGGLASANDVQALLYVADFTG